MIFDVCNLTSLFKKKFVISVLYIPNFGEGDVQSSHFMGEIPSCFSYTRILRTS